MNTTENPPPISPEVKKALAESREKYRALLAELKTYQDRNGWNTSLMSVVNAGTRSDYDDETIRKDIIANSPSRITEHRFKAIDRALKNCRAFSVVPIPVPPKEHMAGKKRAGEMLEQFLAGRTEEHSTPGEPEDPPKPPRFTNFSLMMETGFKRELPSICEHTPGGFLLYRGRCNEIHGEPSVGKTNIALVICSEVMKAGGTVLFLDPEDNPQGIGSRFIALGGRPEDLTWRFFYIQNPEPDEYSGIHEWAKEHKPDLVVLDGLAEALAADGHNEDKPADVLTFFNTQIRPFKEAGFAVLVSDHVKKDTESRGRWMRGSGAKMGNYDGAVYEAKLKQSYTPDIEGFVSLVVSKDRNGGVGPIGHQVTDLHFGKDEDANPHIRFELPQTSKREFLPTCIMERVSKFVETYTGGVSKNQIEQGITGHGPNIRAAIAKLIEKGFLRVEQKGRSHLHFLVSPFREAEWKANN